MLLAPFVLAAAAASAGACPQNPRTADGALAAEAAWVVAIERRDVGALSCVLDPSFSDNNWRGERVTREKVLQNLPRRADSTLHLSELAVTVEGSMAVVRGVNRQTTAAGVEAGAVRFTDVFVYRGHAWRAIAAQETVIQKQ